MKDRILSLVSPDYPWAGRLHWFPSIGSTNDTLKAMAKDGAPHGTVLIAGAQHNGHGRMGRSFHSPEGTGIYLSILLRPECAPADLMHLTCAAAVAMCDAIAACAGFRPGIKWTNDLVYGTRKLGGILTELGLGPRGRLEYCLVGIGINCNQQPEDFPPDLRNMAGSLSMVRGAPLAPEVLAAAMLDALAQMDRDLLARKEQILHSYRENCITLGREICLVRCDSVRHGKALDITEDGALLTLFEDGHLEVVNSGEVSVRGMYGYL